jgi:hypothetical protein
MPMIYMRHPTHGVKIASLEAEAEYDETHGWERYTPGEELAPAVNELRRRGRPRKEPEYGHDGG